MTESPHPAAEPRKILEFEDYTFEVETGVLSKNGEERPLPPRVAGVLRYLSLRAGQIALKEDLLEGLWGDRHVTETSLSEAISLLRSALGDDSKHPRFVETLHRRGYRFIADVKIRRIEGSPPGPEEAERAEPSRALSTVPTADSPGWTGRLAAILLLISLIGATAWYLRRPVEFEIHVERAELGSVRAPALRDRAEMVDSLLPEALARATADRATVFLAEGGKQPKKPWLRRLSSASVRFQVSSRLEQEGDHTLISQVLRREGGEVVWAKATSLTEGELLRWLEAATAQMAAVVTGEEIDSRAAAPGSRLTLASSPEFVRGRRLSRSSDFNLIMGGIEDLRDAVARHPEFAGGHAELARAYLRLRRFPAHTEATVRLVESSAQEALRLDEQSVNALLALAEVDLRYRFMRDRALERATRAVNLEPENPEALQLLALTHSARGDHDRAIELIDRARDLSTLHSRVSWDAGYIYLMARRYEKAIELGRIYHDGQVRETYNLDFLTIDSLRLDGRIQDALDLSNAVLAAKGDPVAESLREYYFRRRAAVESMISLGFNFKGDLVYLTAALGDVEAALEAALPACLGRSGFDVPFWLVDPRIEPLRKSEAFRAVEHCLRQPVEAVPFALPRAEADPT